MKTSIAFAFTTTFALFSSSPSRATATAGGEEEASQSLKKLWSIPFDVDPYPPTELWQVSRKHGVLLAWKYFDPKYQILCAVSAKNGTVLWENGVSGSPYNVGLTVTDDYVWLDSDDVHGNVKVFDTLTGAVHWQPALTYGSDNSPLVIDGNRMVFINATGQNSFSYDTGPLVSIDLAEKKLLWSIEEKKVAQFPVVPMQLGKKVLWAEAGYNFGSGVLHSTDITTGKDEWVRELDNLAGVLVAVNSEPGSFVFPFYSEDFFGTLGITPGSPNTWSPTGSVYDAKTGKNTFNFTRGNLEILYNCAANNPYPFAYKDVLVSLNTVYNLSAGTTHPLDIPVDICLSPYLSEGILVGISNSSNVRITNSTVLFYDVEKVLKNTSNPLVGMYPNGNKYGTITGDPPEPILFTSGVDGQGRYGLVTMKEQNPAAENSAIFRIPLHDDAKNEEVEILEIGVKNPYWNPAHFPEEHLAIYVTDDHLVAYGGF